MKISNKIMLLSGVFGLILTAVSPVSAEGAHGKMWQSADTNQDGSIDRAEFDAMRDAHFVAFDGNGDGLLTADEFKSARDKHRAEMAEKMGKDGDRAASMVARIDTSGDGRITADEWQAHSLTKFVRLDANGDGAVTAEEMPSRRSKHGGNRDHGDDQRKMQGAGGFMDRIDSNGDDQISLTEWNDAGSAMFARLDVNNDGKITAEEFPRHRRHGGQGPDDAPKKP